MDTYLIYAFPFESDGEMRVYVGSTARFKKRMARHRASGKRAMMLPPTVLAGARTRAEAERLESAIAARAAALYNCPVEYGV